MPGDLPRPNPVLIGNLFWAPLIETSKLRGETNVSIERMPRIINVVLWTILKQSPPIFRVQLFAINYVTFHMKSMIYSNLRHIIVTAFNALCIVRCIYSDCLILNNSKGIIVATTIRILPPKSAVARSRNLPTSWTHFTMLWMFWFSEYSLYFLFLSVENLSSS